MPGVRHRERAGGPVLRRLRVADGRHTAPQLEPAAERRMVSVLFTDLVGFTTHAEGRDPEDVRELLSRYFETARAIVDRHGGTIEKFIGDAVVAVWGSPAAHEDDAERSVRAALELVAAVRDLGGEAALELAARAGIATGETAVTIGAVGQGMVAGDIVNTAARIQGGRATGQRVPRRGNAARLRGGHRVRRGGRIRAQGQGRAGAPVGGLACRREPRRRGPVPPVSTRRSPAATTTCACASSCSTPPPSTAARTC